MLKYADDKLIRMRPLASKGVYYAENESKAAEIFLRIFKPKKQMEKHDNKIDHGQRAHALLSASGASRWIACTPSARLEEHFENKGKPNSFAGKYGCHYLIYFERFPNARFAIEREKELKKYSRIKKENLIKATNPNWRFLNEEIKDR